MTVPIRAINAKRQLQYGQAVLLGIVFEDKSLSHMRPPARWHFILPDHLVPRQQGYTGGYYRRRWECVEAALRLVGVVDGI